MESRNEINKLKDKVEELTKAKRLSELNFNKKVDEVTEKLTSLQKI